MNCGIVDLFAGPGGWSEGLRMLGYSELGIEWDEAACATARAAGHERLLADVAALTPGDFAPCWGMIGSAPCPTFSSAGDGAGHLLIEIIVRCAIEIATGNDTRAERREEAYAVLLASGMKEPRARRDANTSMLVVEPLRWARELKPGWIALEQVPPVLSLWELFADILRGWGYSVWTGVLEAERYGVPQTRERAVLMASKDGVAHPPRPTHQRYVPKEPQRHEVTFEGEVLPWVSMADALGWPADLEVHGERGAGMAERHGDRKPRLGAEPAPTVTGGGRALGPRWELRANKQANAAVRDVAEPAPTITGGHDTANRVWQPTHYDQRQTGATPRPVGEPAPTMLSEGLKKGVPIWADQRPSTTVNGDPRISEPGRHDPNESGSQQKNAVRVTVRQAATLQSFRPDYPWQGTKTKQFEQVGNAVPPLLARAVLSALVDEALEEAA